MEDITLGKIKLCATFTKAMEAHTMNETLFIHLEMKDKDRDRAQIERGKSGYYQSKVYHP